MSLSRVSGLTIVLLLFWSDVVTQSEVKELTSDGAWCWFSDPRAIVLNDGRISTGWVKRDGSVEMCLLDPQGNESQKSILFPQMQVDDHNNPAFVQISDEQLLAIYTWHSSRKGIVYHQIDPTQPLKDQYQATIIRPGLNTLLTEFPRETFTYANPFWLEEAQALLTFGRWIGYKPNVIISKDGGDSWVDHKVVISASPFDPNNRPYVKYASNGRDRIDLIFTDGHPRNEPTNSVYHCYYQDRSFYKTNGDKICTLEELPFSPDQATPVYVATEKKGRAWLADLMIDKDNVPHVLYTRHPNEADHRYHYARYDQVSDNWQDHEICSAGKWFPQTQPTAAEREPHYHGNLSIHPTDPQIVYLSRQINNRFEIERWHTKDHGNSWTSTAITKNSTYDNVRPYVATKRDPSQPTVVLWMENEKYIHYTDYKSRILYWVDK